MCVETQFRTTLTVCPKSDILTQNLVFLPVDWEQYGDSCYALNIYIFANRSFEKFELRKTKSEKIKWSKVLWITRLLLDILAG